MLNLNEDDLKAAIVAKAVDTLLNDSDDLSAMVSKLVREKVDKVFVATVNESIAREIDAIVIGGFDREYQKVTSWGEADGPKTTIRKRFEEITESYWRSDVDPSTGKPPTSNYGNKCSRAEYLMTKICAEDFSAMLKQEATNVTGALKDGFRGQLAKIMDAMLNDLFKVKSLQDQGKVEKPY